MIAGDNLRRARSVHTRRASQQPQILCQQHRVGAALQLSRLHCRYVFKEPSPRSRSRLSQTKHSPKSLFGLRQPEPASEVMDLMVYSHWVSPRPGQRPSLRQRRMGCIVLCRTFHTAPEQGQGPSPILVPVPFFVLVPQTV